METQNKLLDRNYIRQDNLITNSRASYTRAEIDLILVILAQINKDDVEFKDYTFTIDELRNRMDKTLTKTTRLKDTAKKLMSRVLEVEESPKKWKLFNWFSCFDYDNGVITCRFDKALKPYLLQIKEQYTLANLKNMLPMDSAYSKRIYLLLMEYRRIGHRSFKVEDLQDILQVPKSLKTYSNFKLKVLTPAIEDINKYGEIFVEMKEIKLVRKVVELEFTFEKNQEDLKAFIEWIRELHPNEPLATSLTDPTQTLKCSGNGLLYFVPNGKTLDKVTAMKEWEYLHPKNGKLLFQQPSLDL